MARIVGMLAVFIIVIAFNSVVVAFFHPFLSSIFILTVLLIDFSAEDKAASGKSPCFVKSPRANPTVAPLKEIYCIKCCSGGLKSLKY